MESITRIVITLHFHARRIRAGQPISIQIIGVGAGQPRLVLKAGVAAQVIVRISQRGATFRGGQDPPHDVVGIGDGGGSARRRVALGQHPVALVVGLGDRVARRRQQAGDVAVGIVSPRLVAAVGIGLLVTYSKALILPVPFVRRLITSSIIVFFKSFRNQQMLSGYVKNTSPITQAFFIIGDPV